MASPADIEPDQWRTILDEHFPGVTTLLGHKLGMSPGSLFQSQSQGPGSPRQGIEELIARQRAKHPVKGGASRGPRGMTGNGNGNPSVAEQLLQGLQHELDKARAQVADLTKANQELTEERDDTARELKRSSATIRTMTRDQTATRDGLRKRLLAMEQECDELRADHREERVKLEKQNTALRSRVTALNVEVKSLKGKLSELRSSRDELADALIELDSETKMLRATGPGRKRETAHKADLVEHAAIVNDQLNASLQAVDHLQDTHRLELDSARAQIESLHKTLAEQSVQATTAIQGGDEAITRLTDQVKTLTQQNTALTREAEQLRADLGHVRASQVQTVEDNWRLTQQVHQMTSASSRKTGEIRALRAALTELKVQSRFEFARNAIETMVNESLSIQSVPGALSRSGDVNLAAMVSNVELQQERETCAELRALLRESEAAEDRLTLEVKEARQMLVRRNDQLRHVLNSKSAADGDQRR